MTDFNTLLKSEIYRERLIDLLCRVSDFLKENPENSFCSVLEEKKREISLTCRETRFFSDQGHFEKWEKLLGEIEEILRAATDGCARYYQ